MSRYTVRLVLEAPEADYEVPQITAAVAFALDPLNEFPRSIKVLKFSVERDE